MVTRINELDLPVPVAPAPVVDLDALTQGIENAQALLIQAIHLYWEKSEKQNPVVAKLKPICLALFTEENRFSDPYTIVCANEPSRFARGFSTLAHELVPAWTLYLNRAMELTPIVEKALQRDNSG